MYFISNYSTNPSIVLALVDALSTVDVCSVDRILVCQSDGSRNLILKCVLVDLVGGPVLVMTTELPPRKSIHLTELGIMCFKVKANYGLVRTFPK